MLLQLCILLVSLRCVSECTRPNHFSIYDCQAKKMKRKKRKKEKMKYGKARELFVDKNQNAKKKKKKSKKENVRGTQTQIS